MQFHQTHVVLQSKIRFLQKKASHIRSNKHISNIKTPHRRLTYCEALKKKRVLHIFPLLIIESLCPLRFRYLHFQQITKSYNTKWDSLLLRLMYL